MLEKNIQNKIRLHASRQGVTLFRNHVGRAVMGKVVLRAKSFSELVSKIRSAAQFVNNRRYIVIESPRETTFGFTPGSSDLVGYIPHYLQGKTAVPVFIETKKPGKKPTPDQRGFLDAVRRAGCIAGVATSDDDFDEIIRRGVVNDGE